MAAGAASAGTLAARFVLDASGFKSEMLETGRISEREFKQLRRQLSFAKDYMNELGRSTKQVNDQVSLKKFSVEIERVAQAANLSTRQVANSMRYIPAQLTDVATQLAGGQSPFLILLQQGGQMKDMFGGFRGMFAALGAYITPFALGMTAAAAAVGAVAYAFWEASESEKQFRNAIMLTGNMAGATASRIRDHTNAIEASSKQTQTGSREIVLEMIKTGQFNNRVMSQMGTAIARYADVSGEETKKVVADFARMGTSTAKWAAEQNKQLNFITVEDYKRLKVLDDKNKKEEAQLLIADRMVAHLKSQRNELGYIDSALEATSKGWSKFWGAMMNWGRPVTLQEQMEAAQTKLSQLKNSIGASPQGIERAEQGVQDLKERIKLERQQADVRSDNASRNQALIQQEIENEAKRKKAADDAAALAKRRAEFIRDLVADINAYNDKAGEMEDATRRVGEADKWAAAEKLKFAKAAELQFSPDLLRQYTADIEAAATRMRAAIGKTTVGSFNDDIEAFAKTTMELEGRTRELGAADKWAAEINARLAKSYEGLTDAQRAGLQATIALEAARRSSAIETQEAAKKEAAFQELLRNKGLVNVEQKTFGEEYDIAAGKYLRNLTDETKMAEQFVAGSFGRMEDAIVNWAKTGKLSAEDLFAYMAEEYIRATLRMAAQKLFLDSAGNFIGWGAMLSKLSSGTGSVPSNREGLEYVPRDGYVAMLHKGERVQTAVEAKQFRSGGSGGAVFDFSGQTVNVGQGVSRSEVNAALRQSQMTTERRIRRLNREGVL